MSKRIHCIEKLGLFQRIEGNIYDSGYWDVSLLRAEALVGGDIYFHKKQKEPSFFGGKIFGVRVHDKDDEYKGRILFRFEFTRDHRGVMAGDGGWSFAMKVVLGR